MMRIKRFCVLLCRYVGPMLLVFLPIGHVSASCDGLLDRLEQIESDRKSKVDELSRKKSCTPDFIFLDKAATNSVRQQILVLRQLEGCPGISQNKAIDWREKLQKKLSELEQNTASGEKLCAERAEAEADVQKSKARIAALKGYMKALDDISDKVERSVAPVRKFLRAEGIGLFTGGSTRKNLKLCELEGSSRCYVFQDGLASGVLNSATLETLRGRVPGAIRRGQGGLNSFVRLKSSIRYDDGGHVRYHFVDAPLGLGRYAGLLCIAYDAEFGNVSPTWEGCGPVDEIRELRSQ